MAIELGQSSQPEAMTGFDGGGSKNSSLAEKSVLNGRLLHGERKEKGKILMVKHKDTQVDKVQRYYNNCSPAMVLEMFVGIS